MINNENDKKSPAEMDQDEGAMNNGAMGGDLGISQDSSSLDSPGRTTNSGSGGTMSGDTGGGTSDPGSQKAGTGSGTQGSASNAGGNATGSAAGNS